MFPQTLRTVALAIGLLSGISSALPALGQTTVQGPSDSDLRKQNQQLQSRVQDLERELKTAQDRIAELEKKIAAGGHSGGSSSTTTAGSPPVEEETTIDESVPGASPRALLRALIERYQNDPAKLEMGKEGDGKRRAYMRRLEGWKATAERELRGPIKWYAQVVGPGNPSFVNGNERVKLIAIDPVSGAHLGAPFDVTLNRTASERLANWVSRGEGDVVVVTGALIPIVTINENRTTRGSFDNPPFIGPFAEMGFDISVQSLTLPKDEAKESTTKPATPATAAPKPVPKPMPKPVPPPVAPGK